ncbi:Uu.00g058190.m01.CDS01 [Anthostomella pinea]|uniref:Uu.00g058190.m01.CDS01 n=1 Tax=Anthostomella pinea TaxID=933095 RepID=A0AAI8YM98_9PEZI|nr:Uu.00g058190.m01.CDS01 [Anthostomella pinea]
MAAQVKGCHLVGSVPLPDAETVFRQCTAGHPDRLKHLPDGEPGFLNLFTTFQSLLFQASPDLCTKFKYNVPVANGEFTEQQIEDAVEKLKQNGPLETHYDTNAIESYGTFRKLKDEGERNKVPGSKVEPTYQDALYCAIRNMQDSIPHGELAIQIDLAVDTAFYEGVLYKPWFGDGNIEKIREFTVDYIVRMVSQVDEDVEVGLHNCYGDMDHRHWMEPKSLAVVTERGLRVFEKSPRSINFFHCPVPKSAGDHLEAYLEPLKELLPKFKEHGTDLYLGVVHYDDSAATQKMIKAAQKVLRDFPFGVGTECGWGRTPPEQVEGIMKISTEVSEPVL